MSKVILCSSKTAETPFTFLNTKVEIYTYEELCFYIFNNTVLISKSVLSEKLFNFIRDMSGPFLHFREDLRVDFLLSGQFTSFHGISRAEELYGHFVQYDLGTQIQVHIQFRFNSYEVTLILFAKIVKIGQTCSLFPHFF